MNRRRALARLCQFGLLGLLAGCAAPARRPSSGAPGWHGRLALRVAADATPEAVLKPAFSAEFDLSGQPEQGDLNFYSPLGNTVAAIRWWPTGASVQARGETRQYASLNRLIIDTLGADVPVAALFDWLAGLARPVPGWRLDLSAREQGKITAYRLTAPAAELRVILDN